MIGVATSGAIHASSSEKLVIPYCQSKQIGALINYSSVSHSTDMSIRASIRFTNRDATCTLSSQNPSVQATAKSTHKPMGLASIANDVAYEPILLHKGQSAFSLVTVASLSSPLVEMAKADGRACFPKSTDSLELHGYLPTWPTRYFVLPNSIMVCTGSFTNISTATFAKVG
jgi:hypothetical protein